MELLLLFSFCFGLPGELSAWETDVAERMKLVPNPYEFYDAPPPDSLLQVDGPWIHREPPRERRFFEMEDSADWMEIKLVRRTTMGLQVEFTGPAEEPPAERKMTNLKWDPYDPRYILTTFGVRLRF
jgi:hypothetical protein